MNVWFVFAIIFGALAAFCGYQGANVQSKEGAEKTERAINDLAKDIQNLKINPSYQGSTEVEAIETKYDAIVKNFVESLPLSRIEAQKKNLEKTSSEIKKTLDAKFRFFWLQDEIEKIVSAYRQRFDFITLEQRKIDNDFQQNLFENTVTVAPPYSLIGYDRDRKLYWVARIITQDGKYVALQLVQVFSADQSGNYDEMILTDNSINVLLMDQFFGLSLNGNIDPQLGNKIREDISLQKLAIEDFEDVLSKLMVLVVEYSLLLESD